MSAGDLSDKSIGKQDTPYRCKLGWNSRRSLISICIDRHVGLVRKGIRQTASQRSHSTVHVTKIPRDFDSQRAAERSWLDRRRIEFRLIGCSSPSWIALRRPWRRPALIAASSSRGTGSCDHGCHRWSTKWASEKIRSHVRLFTYAAVVMLTPVREERCI